MRQLAARARKHVRESRPRFTPAPDDERRYLEAFVHASQSGDVAALEALLSADVRLYSDGGGRVPAAINILDGRRRVGGFLAGIQQKFRRHTTQSIRLDYVNGVLSLITRHIDGSQDVMTIEIGEGGITAVFMLRNPDKLQRLQ